MASRRHTLGDAGGHAEDTQRTMGKHSGAAAGPAARRFVCPKTAPLKQKSVRPKNICVVGWDGMGDVVRRHALGGVGGQEVVDGVGEVRAEEGHHAHDEPAGAGRERRMRRLRRRGGVAVSTEHQKLTTAGGNVRWCGGER